MDNREDPVDRLDDEGNQPTSDQCDTASKTEAIFLAAAMSQRPRTIGPRPDGLCACGCGEDVEPKRLELGLGLSLECARRAERKQAGRRA